MDIKQVLSVFLLLFCASSVAFAGSFNPQDSSMGKSMKCSKMDTCGYQSECKMDSHMKTGQMKQAKGKAVKVINLKAIDKNKDGKVFQCPMDYDVLSDKPGKDPKCGMSLVEVTVEQAKKILTDHGFKVK